MKNDMIQDLVVEKDVKCPHCGGKMKKCESLNGKSEFCCVSCGYKI